MADAYTQLHIQIVIVVERRQNFILPEWEEELYKYITGLVQNRGHKMIAINGMPDHLHLFVGLNPKEALSLLIQELKKASNKWINNQKLLKYKFSWQKGYGAFSYSHSHVERVYNYVMNQKAHHKEKTFREEYLAFLKAFEIDYKDEYLFTFFD